MKRVLVILMLLAAAGASAGKPSASDGFRRRCAERGMVFAPPPGFTVAEVAPNDDVSYDFALRDKKHKLEIRYALGALTPDYAKDLMAVALNVADGDDAEAPDHFPPEAVKAEFNADDGLVTHVRHVRSDFGRGYTQCTVVVLHKRGVGDAFVFFLFDDPAVFESMPDTAFHALAFKR